MTASAVGVLLLTGLLLFDIHPRLYWGDDGHEGVPAFFSISAPDLDRPVLQTDLQVGSHHFDMTGRLGLAIDTGFGDKDFLVFPAPADWDFGATRGWHFLCAWVLVLGAFAYGFYLLASGRLRRMLWPARAELTFASLGREGYREVQQRSSDIARYLAAEIASIGPYELISDGSELPVFAFALRPEVTCYTVYDVSDRLRERGWLVPAYTFPAHREDLSVLRIVVRAGMTMEMAEHLLNSLRELTEFLESLKAPLPDQGAEKRTAFSHN